MQQPPSEQATRFPHAGRTNPALPGASLPTTPVDVPVAQRQRWPQLPAGKRASTLRRIFFQLMLLGLLLGLCFVLLYPLFGEALPGSFVAQALPRAFPWVTQFFWMRQLPQLVGVLAHVSWLDLRAASPVAEANLALLVLGVAGLLLWVAAHAR